MSLGCTYGQTYELLINVIDTNNVPVSGANVEVSGVPSYFLTDSMGSIRLTELSSKSYEIVIQREGYEQSIRKVSIPGDNVITVVLPFKSRWLKEVIVMNDHLRTSRQEEPLNMDVVNRDFIRRNLGGSLMSTLSRLPGIKTIGIGSGQSKPLIRGLGFNRVVVVDKGVKHQGQEWGADHGLEIDQFAAGEVELIKGAASFLYGSDAIGGVINVKPPTVPEINTLG
ncbi:MAG: TonB-dependent receptor plug domain-containing protein, partial [Sphingobacterium sp.]